MTATEVRTAAVTFKVAEPLMVPDAAVMVAVPIFMVVARPVLLTVATEVAEELHVAVSVRFCVVPLL